MSWAIWITGAPGSGKTAIARAAAALLQQRGEPVTLLETDVIREWITPRRLCTATERELVGRALGYMTWQLVAARVPVIVDATTPGRAEPEAARALIRRFAEVQLFCPSDVCRARERTRAREHAAEGTHARGGPSGAPAPQVDVPYEPALVSELVIDTVREDIPMAAARVVALAERLARSGLDEGGA